MTRWDNDTDLREIFTAIADTASTAANPPSAQSQWTRGRRRRSVRLTAQGVGVVALLGALVAVPALVAPGSQFIGPTVLPTPTPSPVASPAPGNPLSQVAPRRGFDPLTPDHYQASYHASPELGGRVLEPIQVVASGVHVGRRWRMVAYRIQQPGKQDPTVCMSVEHEGGDASHGCWSPHQVLTWGGSVSAETLLTGFVTERAALVRVRFRDGGSRDVVPVQAPDGFPVNFWAAVVATGGETMERLASIAALDARGQRICEWGFGSRQRPRLEPNGCA